MQSDFRLLETMKVANGGIYLLARHLDRLSASAENFGFVCDIAAIRGSVLDAAACQREPAVARLLLPSSGEWEVQFRPVPSENPSALRVSPIMVDSSDAALYHKTTAHDLYERAQAG